MKKIYSALSTIALLLSLPAVAAPLAEKATEPKIKERETKEKALKDKVTIEKVAPKSSESPVCRGGGG